jgi:bifunctional polynucleotide phosphatase/kinase
VPIRCVHMTAPAKLCEHNDTVRALSDSVFNPEKRAILPHSAFASFASRFKEPKVQEGFQDVIRVEFQVLTPRVYIFLVPGLMGRWK